MKPLVLALLLTSPYLLPAESKSSNSKQVVPKNCTGYYVNRYSNVADSLKVLQLPNGKIKFELVALLLVGDSPRNGEVHGIAVIKDGVVNYSGEDGCKVKMRFSNNKVNVAVADADACGFGAYVTGDGDYKRKDSKTPKF